jgi:hypothetical protein
VALEAVEEARTPTSSSTGRFMPDLMTGSTPSRLQSHGKRHMSVAQRKHMGENKGGGEAIESGAWVRTDDPSPCGGLAHRWVPPTLTSSDARFTS